VFIAIAALLAWLFRRKQLIPVVTTKILPGPVEGPVQGPSLPGGGFVTGGTHYSDIVIGDALEAWKGIPPCPAGAHKEHDAQNGRVVCVLDSYTLKDVQLARRDGRSQSMPFTAPLRSAWRLPVLRRIRAAGPGLQGATVLSPTSSTSSRRSGARSAKRKDFSPPIRT